MSIANPTPGLALALGSSFLGAYCHAGFLNGLHAMGIVPERISGSSAGAIAGGLFCAGLRGEALERAALDPAWRWSFADLSHIYRLPGLLTGLWSSGLLSGHRAVKHFRNLLGEIDVSSLDHVKLEIAVTDAVNHRPEILRSGPLAELIIASCAVPGLIAIQNVGAARYLDGGVAHEIPFEHWLDDPGVETILLHRVRREKREVRSRDNLLRSITATHHTVCGEFHRRRMELARERGKRVIEITSTTPPPRIVTGGNARACYEIGFAAGSSVTL